MISADNWIEMLAILVAFLLSAGAARWLCHADVAFLRILDHANERSLHSGAIPRTGGLAILAALAAAGAVLLWSGQWSPGLLWGGASLILVAGISLADDRTEVSPRLRFLVHLAAAALLIPGGMIWAELSLPGISMPLASLFSIPLTLLYVVWMINLYNFMDGMDGFAGGMAVFGFGAFAILGWQAGDPGFATLCAVVAAAAAGFLLTNFPPAGIFLGDVGSSSLGLLAAALSLWADQQGLFPLWLAWLVFSPFILDATWTLLRRILQGEKWWLAHRSHHYQRLVLAGWGHRKTLLRAYLLMAATAATAVVTARSPAHDQWVVLAMWAAIYLLVHFKVALVERAAGGGRT